MEAEISRGKNIALAASDISTLRIFVYSTLPGAKEISKGKYPNSVHWEAKAEIVKLIRTEFKELAAKLSLIFPGMYMQMFRWNPMIQPQLTPSENGDPQWTFAFASSAEARLPWINVINSTGSFVYALVKSEPVGTNLVACDSEVTVDELMSIFSRNTGQPITFKPLSLEEAEEKLPLPREVLEGNAFISEYGYTGGDL